MLARYGVRQVLEALAKARKQTPEEIERELARLETRRAERRSKPDKAPESLLARLPVKDPEQASLIKELIGFYQEKRFLPSLRAAEEFVAHRTGRHSKFKSRKAAQPALVRALAGIPSEGLRTLRNDCTYAQTSGDYELLAGAIMGAK